MASASTAPTAQPGASMTARQSESPLEDFVSVGKAIGDRLRVGILHVLHQDSYSVGELCELFDVPQPALSHHLKILHQTGLVAKRREGNNIFYRRASPGERVFGNAMLETLDRLPIAAGLQLNIQAIHAARRQRSEEFFALNAADFATHQARICEPVVYTDTVAEMLDTALRADLHTEHALEVGPGDGRLLNWLAKPFTQVTGIDSSKLMLETAAANTRNLPNVTLKHQDFLDLQGNSKFDAIIAAMVIHHLPSPATFFSQAQQMLKPGGVLIVAELCPHDQQWAVDACGDQWLGFEAAELDRWARNAAFESGQSQFLAQKNGFRIQIHQYQSIHKRKHKHKQGNKHP